MGCCNGRKNRVKPTGTASRKPSTQGAESKASSTRMTSGRTATFTVQTNTGKKLSFGSELEARAEVVRNGGILKF